MAHLARSPLRIGPNRLRKPLFVVFLAAGALLLGYYLGGSHRRQGRSVDDLVAGAYRHDVGHCEIDRVLTAAIRKAGGGQTGYTCGKRGYSAIIDVSGNVAIGGIPRREP